MSVLPFGDLRHPSSRPEAPEAAEKTNGPVTTFGLGSQAYSDVSRSCRHRAQSLASLKKDGHNHECLVAKQCSKMPGVETIKRP